jgi:hypothetical protein
MSALGQNGFQIWMSVVIRIIATFLILAYVASSIASSHELMHYGPTRRISSCFSELAYISLVLEYGTIVSALAGIYYWWIGQRIAVPPPHKPDGHATRGRARQP